MEVKEDIGLGRGEGIGVGVEGRDLDEETEEDVSRRRVVEDGVGG